MILSARQSAHRSRRPLKQHQARSTAGGMTRLMEWSLHWEKRKLAQSGCWRSRHFEQIAAWAGSPDPESRPLQLVATAARRSCAQADVRSRAMYRRTRSGSPLCSRIGLPCSCARRHGLANIIRRFSVYRGCHTSTEIGHGRLFLHAFQSPLGLAAAVCIPPHGREVNRRRL